MQADMTQPRRQITGRTVLLCMIAFFGIISAVNAVMIKVAVSTFAGVDTDSAYRAGLGYKKEEAAAAAQQALNWTVEGRLNRAPSGLATLSVDVKDAQQRPVNNVVVNARLSHPATARHDQAIVLTQMPDGSFSGQAEATPGQWLLTLDVIRGETRLYRSVSRLMLK
jgi:nitrogen fixation protein FixH